MLLVHIPTDAKHGTANLIANWNNMNLIGRESPSEPVLAFRLQTLFGSLHRIVLEDFIHLFILFLFLFLFFWSGLLCTT